MIRLPTKSDATWSHFIAGSYTQIETHMWTLQKSHVSIPLFVAPQAPSYKLNPINLACIGLEKAPGTNPILFSRPPCRIVCVPWSNKVKNICYTRIIIFKEFLLKSFVWFVGWVLHHINHCWLFNAKSCFYIFIKYMICKHILQIHTVKWSNSSIYDNPIQHKSTKLNGSKYCYVSLTIQLNISHLFTHNQTVLFQIVQFILSFVYTQFKRQAILFDLLIKPYQELPLRSRLDLGAMTMKEYTPFPKAPALLEPLHQIV